MFFLLFFFFCFFISFVCFLFTCKYSYSWMSDNEVTILMAYASVADTWGIVTTRVVVLAITLFQVKD